MKFLTDCRSVSSSPRIPGTKEKKNHF